MAQAGGSATIYGVLYQALGASHWAATISLKSVLTSQDFASAQLIIEPRGGGGDLVIAMDERRIVEQWKAKSDYGTWSVRALITQVFPDLYRAVDSTNMGRPVEYCFVSEGREGHWKDLHWLLKKTRTSDEPEDPLLELNDSQPRRFLSDCDMTERAFFLWIAETLRQHEDIARESAELTRKKLWHLIANFRLHAERTLEKVQAELDHLLLGAVDFREQIPGKRRELCGLVLELAGRREVTVAATDFLSLAQIEADSFTKWTKLRTRLCNEAARRARQDWHYRIDQDVRAVPNWPVNSPVLVLSGESGQGKTWQLGALAMHIAETEGLAVTTTASGDADRDLQSVANVIWQIGLGHDQTLSLARIVERRRDVAPKLESPWLTVFVDDVLSIEEARRLVSHDWIGDGARLAITTLPAIARALKSQFRDIVHIEDVEDFSLSEAQDYLRRCGHDWGRLPPDVREILKRPLLARLFAELVVDDRWLPTHEYELFEEFWRRIRDARHQAVYPGDVTWMRKLAGTVLDESLPYPWMQSDLVEFGLQSEVQVRLESVGWLRRLDRDRVEVWHDRVLNWAVSEELVARRESQILSAEGLGNSVAKLWGTSERRSGLYLGYVPLDVLWIIGDPAHSLRSELPNLIEALENAPGGHHDLERLYGESLPTLGERAIDGIVRRVKSVPKIEGNRYPYLAAHAIASIGVANNSAAARSGRALINDRDHDLQLVGLRVLAAVPDPSALDRLWELHQACCKNKGSEDFRDWWPRYEAGFEALRGGIKQYPQWLKNQIDVADPAQAPVHELAYLLACLEGDAGRQLWQEQKLVLFAKVSPDKLRSVARCIEHFHDNAEIERLENWLSISADSLAPTALMALSRMDPQRALRGLRLMNPTDLYACRNWWLCQLAARCPGETQEAIRGLMLANPQSKWLLARIYENSVHLMDAETLRLLLDELEHLAVSRLQHPKTDLPLLLAVTLLEKAASPHLLVVFESYAGATLENRLVEVAKSRLDRAGLYVDYELDGIRSVLLKINGPGLTKMVNAELSSKSKYSRREGVEKSLIRPDRVTRELLRAQIDDEEYWDENGFPLVQKKSAVMLAALGENAFVVRSILRWKGVLNKLSDVRHGMPSMSDADLTDAIAAINTGDDEQCTRGLWALSVSGRRDLDSTVIDVLRRADLNSELARSAIWALGDMDCRSTLAVALIEPHLAIEGHKYAAVISLARMGTPEAMASLERCLVRDGIATRKIEDSILAANLSRREGSRAAVLTAVWNTVQTDPSWSGLPELFELLAAKDEVEVREWLLRQAYEPDGVTRTTGRRVWIIRALAKIDGEAAFQAARSALSSGCHDSVEIAKTFVELDSKRAVPLACGIAAEGVKAAVRYAIGHALRRVKQEEVVCATLATLLQSENADQRKVAVELAGWAGPGAVTASKLRAAMDDYSIAVRIAACKALQHHQVEAYSIKLLALLKESRGARTWSLLDAILRSANPHALQTNGDPLYLKTAYPDDDMPYWLYSNQRIEQRLKDIATGLDDMDRRDD